MFSILIDTRNITTSTKPSLSKKDAVDIDKFTEYSKLVEKIFEEEPTKLFVYLSLEDVKMNAKVPSHHKHLMILLTIL